MKTFSFAASVIKYVTLRTAYIGEILTSRDTHGGPSSVFLMSNAYCEGDINRSSCEKIYYATSQAT